MNDDRRHEDADRDTDQRFLDDTTGSGGLLTARQVAELLNFAPGTIVDWAERGELPSFKISGRLRFERNEILGWLQNRRSRVTEAAKREARLAAQHEHDLAAVRHMREVDHAVDHYLGLKRDAA
jgi:excisionase family DNA binding protein